MKKPLELLVELLQIDTTNPPGNEGPAAEILRDYLDEAGAETHMHTTTVGRPSLIARVEGDTSLPALVLVSHTDVVGVEPESWTHDPFGGEIADGHVWGRGALDMKSVAVMHAHALAELASNGDQPRREVIVVAVADEEAGGREGAATVVRDLPERVGFGEGRPAPEALGEGAFGLAGILDEPLMPIVVGEKSVLWLDLKATGEPGHGALPPVRQANINLARALTKISGFGRPRVHPVMREQFRALAEHSTGARAATFRALASGVGSQVAAALKKPLRGKGAIAALLADTLTPTQLEAGYKHNVVPGEARASLDCRLLPDTQPDDLIAKLKKTCARLDVEIEEVARHSGPVSEHAPLFDTLVRASAAMIERPVPVPSLTAGMTDLRYFRQRGATAYGWVPLVIDETLLATIHGHDERVPVEGFEQAVRTMSVVVKNAAG